MKNTSLEQPQGSPSNQELAQEFIKKYEALCEETGFQIIVTPAWKISQDTGTWSTVLQSSIGEIPKKNDK